MFNYYFDKERDGHAATVKMFEAMIAGEYEGYTSEYVAFELRNSTEPKRSEMLALIEKYGIAVFEPDEETTRLADVYIREGIIPEKYRFDGTHIACASTHGLDGVLSFNFQHINKLKTKQMTALINLREGYKSVIICTPMEVLENEELD
jgi:predicted nucleic acid-binding protein